MESFEKVPLHRPKWIRPNLDHERGEIERVTREFLEQEQIKENIVTLNKILESAPIVELTDEEWKTL